MLNRLALVRVLALSLTLGSAATQASDSLQQAMYFKAQPKDAANCALDVKKGQIVFAKSISNPAVSCPDAFAWKRFLETVKAEFWNNWSYDSYTYPAKPYALCDSSSDDNSCCDPANNRNPGYDNKDNPGQHCPYFPGDHKDQHLVTAKTQTKNLAKSPHGSLTNQVDPGRVIRQEMAEVVFRNRPMWQYSFEKNLYNSEGLAQVLKDRTTQITDKAPYHKINTRIDYPTDAIMFKTDWLHEDEAKKLGLKQNKEHPYITMYMRSSVGDNDSNRFREGLHYLMAITAASKDLPNWHWYAIEHVNNPGRCDYTGCNDSYGYYTTDTIPQGYARNYVAPHTLNDGLVSSSPIFDAGKPYAAETINPELANIFKKMKIGQKSTKNNKKPSAQDAAWLSYRLKGVQTEFVTTEGINTIVGNSVTEGGFVNTSSCMTCHSQAAVNEQGTVAINSFGFSNQMNLLGYPQSSNGVPENSWFYQPGTTTPLNEKTDYVWGILFAQPLATPK